MTERQAHAPDPATTIRPFRIAIDDAELEELRGRLATARWPGEPAETGRDRGVPLEYLRRLANAGRPTTTGVGTRPA